jgi:hypothetical protein
MRDELLKLLPDEILNLIFIRVKPSLKYNLNKDFFYKYYKYRFNIINENYFILSNKKTDINKYIIKNYNYIKYLIQYDINLSMNLILLSKFSNNNNNNNFNNKKIIFQNKKFNNFLDFCYYYSKKYNSNNILDILLNNYIQFINLNNKNNISYIHNKNNKWIA